LTLSMKEGNNSNMEQNLKKETKIPEVLQKFKE